jgi:anti-anti-sigma factor
MPSNFRVDVSSEDGAAVIAVAGELDLATSPALEEQFERVMGGPATLVVIDLRELEFMDSTGLSVIIRAHQRAEQGGHRLGIVNGSRQVRRLLSLTGVADRLVIVDDLAELLNA